MRAIAQPFDDASAAKRNAAVLVKVTSQLHADPDSKSKAEPSAKTKAPQPYAVDTAVRRLRIRSITSGSCVSASESELCPRQTTS